MTKSDNRGGYREGAGRPATGRTRKQYYVTYFEDAQINALLGQLRGEERRMEWKTIEVMAPELDKYGDPDWDRVRVSEKKRFKNGENAENWAISIDKYIDQICGNGWPRRVLVDGVQVRADMVSIKF